jgi:hypothetical protein
MYQPNQRVTLDLSSLMIKGVFFSQNVQKAIGTIVQQVSTTPPVYLVELEIGTRPLAAHCHLGLGKLYHRTDKREQAQEHLTTATTMYRKMGMTYWLEKADAEMTEPGR